AADAAALVHLAGAVVDVDAADVAAEGKSRLRRVVIVDRLEARLHALRMIRVGRERDLLDRLGLLRRALDRELPGLPDEVVLGDFQQIRGDLLRLVAHLARRDRPGRAGGRRRARGV